MDAGEIDDQDDEDYEERLSGRGAERKVRFYSCLQIKEAKEHLQQSSSKGFLAGKRLHGALHTS